MFRSNFRNDIPPVYFDIKRNPDLSIEFSNDTKSPARMETFTGSLEVPEANSVANTITPITAGVTCTINSENETSRYNTPTGSNVVDTADTFDFPSMPPTPKKPKLLRTSGNAKGGKKEMYENQKRLYSEFNPTGVVSDNMESVDSNTVAHGDEKSSRVLLEEIKEMKKKNADMVVKLSTMKTELANCNLARIKVATELEAYQATNMMLNEKAVLAGKQLSTIQDDLSTATNEIKEYKHQEKADADSIAIYKEQISNFEANPALTTAKHMEGKFKSCEVKLVQATRDAVDMTRTLQATKADLHDAQKTLHKMSNGLEATMKELDVANKRLATRESTKAFIDTTKKMLVDMTTKAKLLQDEKASYETIASTNRSEIVAIKIGLADMTTKAKLLQDDKASYDIIASTNRSEILKLKSRIFNVTHDMAAREKIANTTHKAITQNMRGNIDTYTKLQADNVRELAENKIEIGDLKERVQKAEKFAELSKFEMTHAAASLSTTEADLQYTKFSLLALQKLQDAHKEDRITPLRIMAKSIGTLMWEMTGKDTDTVASVMTKELEHLAFEACKTMREDKNGEPPCLVVSLRHNEFLRDSLLENGPVNNEVTREVHEAVDQKLEEVPQVVSQMGQEHECDDSVQMSLT